MATVSVRDKSDKPILWRIEGATKWNGILSINFLDPSDPAELNRYSTFNSLNGNYLGGATGINTPNTADWQTQIELAATLYTRVANISIVFNNDINANYLVSGAARTSSNLYGYWTLHNANQQNAGFNINYSAMLNAAELGGGSDRIQTLTGPH